MKCHECQFHDSKVIESRDVDDAATIRRRRQCLGCGTRFTTYERLELPAVTIVKHDGRREVFARPKLAAGIYRAVEKRPLPILDVEALITRIEREVRGSGELEIPSDQVGELVMNGLEELDQVAFVRFASVYRRFTDVASFEAELRRLRSRTP